MSVEEIKSAIAANHEAIMDGVGGIKSDVAALEGRMDELEIKAQRPGKPTPQDEKAAPAALETKTGKLHILSKGQKVTDCYPRPEGDGFSLGEFVKGALGLESKSTVVGSSATVPTYVSGKIIDAVRAKSRVIQAGAVSLAIDGPTKMGRIASDPTCYQHSEGASDISESAPGLEAVTLDPKALVCLIPVSAEILMDSPNIDALLQTSIAASVAGKLDSLALAAILANTDIPTSTGAEDPATWSGLTGAVSSMLTANMDLPQAGIFNSADFMARNTELASTSGAWLGAPGVLAGMLDLETSKLDAGTAILGNFAGIGIATRSTLMVEVVRFAKATSYSHYILAHARMEAVVLQPNGLYVAKKTVA